jgi:hypothetical protein
MLPLVEVNSLNFKTRLSVSLVNIAALNVGTADVATDCPMDTVTEPVVVSTPTPVPALTAVTLAAVYVVDIELPFQVPLVIVPTVAKFDNDVNDVFELAVMFVAFPVNVPIKLPEFIVTPELSTVIILVQVPPPVPAELYQWVKPPVLRLSIAPCGTLSPFASGAPHQTDAVDVPLKYTVLLVSVAFPPNELPNVTLLAPDENLTRFDVAVPLLK